MIRIIGRLSGHFRRGLSFLRAGSHLTGQLCGALGQLIVLLHDWPWGLKGCPSWSQILLAKFQVVWHVVLNCVEDIFIQRNVSWTSKWILAERRRHNSIGPVLSLFLPILIGWDNGIYTIIGVNVWWLNTLMVFGSVPNSLPSRLPLRQLWVNPCLLEAHLRTL